MALAIERRERQTVMDGRVFMYATQFELLPGLLAGHFVAGGPFYVSASRNAVMIHRADLRTDEERDAFIEAVKEAFGTHKILRDTA